MGDPQAPFAKVLEVLDRHGALTADGRVAADVVLVSIGDHFDYDQHDPVAAGAEGVALLRWLASHDPAHVHIMLGNHDASRVMELAGFDDDARFAEARTLARNDDAAFAARYPDVPTPGTVGRDFASYSTEQRALVIELLLARRFRLALAAELADGRRALVTHAGVTTRELALLGVDAEPFAIAAALERALAQAVDRVRPQGERGEHTAALSLEPLHLAGVAGEEGGGLLYHRPSNPDRPDASAFSPTRPRRFDPRRLPAGLTQIAGHNGHAKCMHELGDWVQPGARARAHGGIRTLRVVDGDAVSYDLGIAPARADAADLILIDGELRRVAASDFALLEVRRLL
jgi:hypothetical protein